MRGEGTGDPGGRGRRQRHRGRAAGDDAARPDLAYPGARQEEGEGLPAILAAEQGLDDDFNSPFNRAKRFIADHALVLALVIAALAALALFVLPVARARARRRRARVPARTARRCPPALAYGLAHEGGDSTDTVLATLLDLVDRGYYETSEATTDEEKLDLALEAEGRAPRRASSPATSRQVLEFFDKLLDGEQVALSEMKDKVPQHSEVWRGRWERMTEQLDDAESGELAWDPRPQLGAVAGGRWSPRRCSRSSSSPTSSVNEEWLAALGGRRR